MYQCINTSTFFSSILKILGHFSACAYEDNIWLCLVAQVEIILYLKNKLLFWNYKKTPHFSVVLKTNCI